MIETLILIGVGVLGFGIGFLSAKYYGKIDVNKINVADIKEVYNMTEDFISGGDDKKIDPSDALVLLSRLEKLANENKKEEKVMLLDDEFGDVLKEESDNETQDPTK